MPLNEKGYDAQIRFVVKSDLKSMTLLSCSPERRAGWSSS
jgi:hypothetical protein